MLLSDSDRFEVVSMRQRIFRRREGRPEAPRPPVHVRLDPTPVGGPRSSSPKRMIRDLLVDSSPLAVVGLDVDGIIVAASAQARALFGLTSHDLGRPFRDHELSYRPAELRSIIEQAQQERRAIRLNAVEHHVDAGDPRFYDILVQPLSSAEGLPLGTSITFLDTTLQTRLQQEVKRVREDLEAAYEELQSTNEELETTNEELQSSIEELETTNEELQSTNEELETTNEELQSGNEELETMNEEMRIRTAEIDEARSHLEQVLASIGAGVVVVDTGLLVQEWNKGAEDLWGLRAGEVHLQPFFDLEFGLPTGELRGIVHECLGTSTRTGPVELPAVTRTGRTITCRVTCYPLDRRPEGAVLMMEAVDGA